MVSSSGGGSSSPCSCRNPKSSGDVGAESDGCGRDVRDVLRPGEWRGREGASSSTSICRSSSLVRCDATTRACSASTQILNFLEMTSLGMSMAAGTAVDLNSLRPDGPRECGPDSPALVKKMTRAETSSTCTAVWCRSRLCKCPRRRASEASSQLASSALSWPRTIWIASSREMCRQTSALQITRNLSSSSSLRVKNCGSHATPIRFAAALPRHLVVLRPGMSEFCWYTRIGL
mmetsp:Transcript_42109/g.98761  ORF Transcript_42109/g.98761 Transcript_42109/m.98761 type:complete len:233 (-) Transcript_42109:816-1514(-)